jgi:photosystem II stability/assembly factor-like uncharacterized protein
MGRPLLSLCRILVLFSLPAAFAPAARQGPLLLDAARAGESAIVAVGERGLILRWTEQDPQWRPATVPDVWTLCGVSFVDAEVGFAGGHDGFILRTSDGGASWTVVHQSRDRETAFLDLLALDRQQVIAVGGFGTYLETKDGGATWEARRLLDEDVHLNRITRDAAGTLFLAGEAGTLLRSRDRGRTWTRLETDNEGSFYGVLPLDDGALLAYGLRGRVYRSEDDGGTWEEVPSGSEGLLLTGVQLPGGTIVLAGQARTCLASRDGGRTFSRVQTEVAAIAELLVAGDHELLSFGEAGIARIHVP